MKATSVIAAALLATACAAEPAASLGDSPLKEVRCPTFLDDTGCIERAKRTCGTERVTVVSAPADVDVLGKGKTVPIEGTIRHRVLVVRCEYE